MFEAAITPAVAGIGAPGNLRPLDWSELVARLAAARDLRDVLSRPAMVAGSFVGQARGGLARAGNGERAVNLDALGRGKTPQGITFANVEEAAGGDQGTQ